MCAVRQVGNWYGSTARLERGDLEKLHLIIALRRCGAYQAGIVVLGAVDAAAHAMRFKIGLKAEIFRFVFTEFIVEPSWMRGRRDTNRHAVVNRLDGFLGGGGEDHAIGGILCAIGREPEAAEKEEGTVGGCDVVGLFSDAVIEPLVESVCGNEATLGLPALPEAGGAVGGFDAGVDMKILGGSQTPMHGSEAFRAQGEDFPAR